MKFYKRSAIIIVLCLVTAQIISAQTLKAEKPELEGFSSERLQNIDKMLHKFTDEHKMAGTVALVARHGHIVLLTAAGYKDIKANQLLKTDDIFRIASQTKLVTCTAIMMLYEEGKLLLDDPVSKYIPEFSKPTVIKTFNEKDSTYTTEPANREITIHDLLTHTSGLSYAIIGQKEGASIYKKANIPMGFEPRHFKLADKMKALGKLPLMHQPGTKYTYGLNMDVLGYVIEVVSGKSLNDFFKDRLFIPLGMKDTYFYVPVEKQSRMSKVYSGNSKGEIVENTSADSTGINVVYPFTKNGTYYSGGAGLSSTAYDYALLLQMLLNGGELNGKRYLSPNIIRLMRINQIGDMALGTSPNKVGFSTEVVTEKGAAVLPWHEGTYAGGGFWGSNYWVDPKSDMVVQIWTQNGNMYLGDMINKFKAMVYGALLQ